MVRPWFFMHIAFSGIMDGWQLRTPKNSGNMSVNQSRTLIQKMRSNPADMA